VRTAAAARRDLLDALLRPLRAAGRDPRAELSGSHPFRRRAAGRGVADHGRNSIRRSTMTTLAATDYPILGVMWSLFLIFGLVVFFWLLFDVFGDLFRRQDLGGGQKTLWTIFVLFLPFLGAFTYLILNGRDMADRKARAAARERQRTEEYIRSVAADSTTGTEEVARGKQLLDSGAITSEEFDAIKRRALV
jgi:ABC-type multidrug transport system fused ATPase/permease subunit